jgi:hypothetical protein
MILATYVLLMAATLEIGAENASDVTVEYAELFKSAEVTSRANASCTSAGVFAINCTSYLVCAPINGGFMGAEGTCPPQQNFDPFTKQCSFSYVCPPSCTAPGFICHTSTSFTLCAAAGVAVVKNQTCPIGYFCNQKCIFPCVCNIGYC